MLVSKVCSSCKEEKPTTEFRPRRGQCKVCEIEYNRLRYQGLLPSKKGLSNEAVRENANKATKNWQQNNPERVRKAHVERTYGISWEEYTKMYENQGGACEVCRSPMSLYKGHTTFPVAHVDHSHSTGKVRGLLCPKCNKGAGHFEDNIDLMYRIAEYLSKHKEIM